MRLTNRKKLLKTVILAGVEAGLADGVPDQALLSIVLLGPKCMRDTNRRFLAHDYVTDVIAFDFRGEDACDEEPTLGEVLVCPAKACENAEFFRTAPEREIVLCIVHGILHVTGMTDSTDSGKALMREQEDRILSLVESRLGFDDLFEVYA